MRLITLVVTGLWACCLALPASAQDHTTWQIGTGFDYSSGRYGGTSDTTVLNVPLDVRVQLDRLRLDLSIPYVDIKGPGTFAGGVVVPGSSTVTRRSGLGDINLGAAWRITTDDPSFPGLELAGTVKIPTAKVGLGTGKPDFTALMNVNHTLSPKVLLFGSVGYQWLGNFRSFELKNGVLASAGVNFKPGQTTSLGLTASYRAEYWQGLGDAISLSPYFLWNFDKNWRITAYGVFGLSDASPRAGGGLRLAFFQ